jgi:hypothetical protein
MPETPGGLLSKLKIPIREKRQEENMNHGVSRRNRAIQSPAFSLVSSEVSHGVSRRNIDIKLRVPLCTPWWLFFKDSPRRFAEYLKKGSAANDR